MKRLSLHIGLNHIDPEVYGEGNDLINCLNDCDFYTRVANDNGFTTTVLKDDEATSARVTAELCKAASTLSSGDYFLVTYAGHGSQVPDEDNEEDDGMNETWVLYDRQMVDNEIYRMWGNFKAGVKIFVISDSCHSGTLMRPFLIQVKPKIRNLSPLGRSYRVLKSLRDIDNTSKGEIIKQIRSLTVGKKADKKRETAASEKIRLLHAGVSLENYVNNRDLYRNFMLLAGDKRDITINASLLYISGCQDNQTSGDGPEGTNGTFTGNLKRVWNDGAFSGVYYDLYTRTCSLMPSVQSPNYMKLGVTNPDYENEKPFFASSQETTTTVPQPFESDKPIAEPTEVVKDTTENDTENASVAISDSVGKGGANKSGDVKIIQGLLNKVPEEEGGVAVKLKVDGLFGNKTLNAIMGFQMYWGYDIGDEYCIIRPGSDTFCELVSISSRGISEMKAE